MALADNYVQKDTPIHRIDPRVKLIFAVLLTAFCFFISDMIMLVLLLISVQLFIASTGVKWKNYVSSFWLVVRFSLLLVLLWPFFDKAGDPTLLDLWVYKVTIPSLERGATVMLRILTMASGWMILLFTTRQGVLVRGMVKMGMRYDYGLSISIALRYIPHFISAIDQIREAQASRGFDYAKGGPIRRARNFVPVLIPTVVNALRNAEGLSIALVCRGYGMDNPRTYHHDIRLRGADVAILAVMASSMPILMVLDLMRIISI